MSYAKSISKYFNELRADNLEILDGFYAQDAEFIDPLASHKGLDSIKSYYENIYKNVIDIRFEFHKFIESGQDCSATWTMHLTAKSLNQGQPTQLAGSSFFEFNGYDKVAKHRDYYDMHEFIYQYIPVVGYLTNKVNKALTGKKKPK
jgi:ketosteroid isomerase-like protein